LAGGTWQFRTVPADNTPLGIDKHQLLAFVREHGKITNRAFRELTGLSDEAARKEIKGVLALGLLRQVGKGRSTAYIRKRRVVD
jgi:ATP-dependent DNA helicase RecG